MIDVVHPYIQESRSRDEWLHHAGWKVTLNDNRTIYSNAHRRSWLELKAYLNDNPHLYIISMHLMFRDNYIEVGTGCLNYFFAQAIEMWYGGPSRKKFLAGYLDGDKVLVRAYHIPELVFINEERRSFEDGIIKLGLIKN